MTFISEKVASHTDFTVIVNSNKNLILWQIKGRTYTSVSFYRAAWCPAGPDRSKLKAALPSVEESLLNNSERKRKKEKKPTLSKHARLLGLDCPLCPLVVGYMSDSPLTASCLCRSLWREPSRSVWRQQRRRRGWRPSLDVKQNCSCMHIWPQSQREHT